MKIISKKNKGNSIHLMPFTRVRLPRENKVIKALVMTQCLDLKAVSKPLLK